MAESRRFGWSFWLRLTVAIALLALLLTQVPWSEVVTAARAIPWYVIVAGLGLFMVVRYILAWQMVVLFPRSVRHLIGPFQVWSIQMAAAFYGLVLPGELAGGGVIWWKLARAGAGRFRAGWIVVYVRLTLLFAVALLAFLGLTLGGQQVTVAGSIRWVVAVFLLLMVIGAAPFFHAGAGRLVETLLTRWIPPWRITRWLAAATDRIADTLQAFRADHGAGAAAWQFAGSLLQQTVETIWFLLLARAMEFDVGFWDIAWIRGAVVLLQMLPITIGGLGVREVSLVALLGLFGVGEAQAVAYSLTIFAVTVGGGLVGMLLEWNTWMAYLRSKRDGNSTTEPPTV